jgi:hypothetical protein
MIPTPTNTFVRLNSSPPSIATPMPTTEDKVPIAARPMCILLSSNLRRSGLSGLEVFGAIWNILIVLIARLRALAVQMLRVSTLDGPARRLPDKTRWFQVANLLSWCTRGVCNQSVFPPPNRAYSYQPTARHLPSVFSGIVTQASLAHIASCAMFARAQAIKARAAGVGSVPLR